MFYGQAVFVDSARFLFQRVGVVSADAGYAGAVKAVGAAVPKGVLSAVDVYVVQGGSVFDG